jgi:hypothetical protein
MISRLSQTNPKGLEGARSTVENIFAVTKGIAAMTVNPNPADDGTTASTKTKYIYNIRTRLLVLKEAPVKYQTDNPLILRTIRIIRGGTTDAAKKSAADYRWFPMEGTPDRYLPDGFFFLPPGMGSGSEITNGAEMKDMEKFASQINNNEDDNAQDRSTMTFNFQQDISITQDGKNGDSTWYFYEFNRDGTSNSLPYSTFVVARGHNDPSTTATEKPRVIIDLDEDKNPAEITGVFIGAMSDMIVPFVEREEIVKLANQ